MEDAGQAAPDAQACSDYWAAVLAQEDALARMESIALMEQLNADLEPVAPGIAVEVGGERQGRRELVLTAHGALERFEAVQALARHAPALGRFDVVPFRRRTPEGFSMRMDGFELSTSDVQVRYWPEAGQVALELAFARQLPMDMRDHARHMAYIMLDHMLGEYDFAVKVGSVDFAEDALEGAVDLNALVPLFDKCWRQALGRTGDFPRQADQWTMLSVRRKSGDEFLVVRNDAANAVAGRADLTYRLCVRLPAADTAQLDAARTYEERLSEQLEPGERGICSHVVLDEGVRAMHWHVGDLEAAMREAEALLQALELASAQVEAAYDPAWEDYLQWAAEA